MPTVPGGRPRARRVGSTSAFGRTVLLTYGSSFIYIRFSQNSRTAGCSDGALPGLRATFSDGVLTCVITCDVMCMKVINAYTNENMASWTCTPDVWMQWGRIVWDPSSTLVAIASSTGTVIVHTRAGELLCTITTTTAATTAAQARATYKGNRQGQAQAQGIDGGGNYADPAAAVAGLAFCNVSKKKVVLAVLGYDGILRVCSIPDEISDDYAADQLDFEVSELLNCYYRERERERKRGITASLSLTHTRARARTHGRERGYFRSPKDMIFVWKMYGTMTSGIQRLRLTSEHIFLRLVQWRLLQASRCF